MAWIHVVIDLPDPTLERATTFWERSLGWQLGRPWSGHPELSSFEPPLGNSYVHRQRIDGPARVHIDVAVADPLRDRARWVDLGAKTVGRDPEPGRTSWQAMQSPGGMPFCLVPTRVQNAPSAVSWPSRHRSRLVQICIDMPLPHQDDEVAFWRSALEWRWGESTGPEFVGRMHDDDGSPIQLLFQRINEPTGPVRAHIDLGTDNLDQEVARQIELGAAELRPDLRDPHSGFVALRDPAGLAYCVTGNAPESTQHRDIGISRAAAPS